MTSTPNLFHGAGEGRFGSKGPNLETTTVAARSAFRLLFEQLQDDIPLPSILKGNINNFTFEKKGDFNNLRYKKTLYTSAWCDVKMDAGAGFDFQFKNQTTGFSDAVIIPLINGLQYLSQSTSLPNAEGLAQGTIKYQLSTNLNLSGIDSRITFGGSGIVGASLKVCGIPKNVGPRFNLPTSTEKLRFPGNHPFSLDMTVTVPSFNSGDDANLKTNNAAGISYAKNPKPTKVEISNLKTNGLFKKTFDSVSAPFGTKLGNAIVDSFGIIASAVKTVCPSCAREAAEGIGSLIMGTVKSQFANKKLEEMEQELQKAFPIEANKLLKDGNNAFNMFKNGFSATVADLAWNETDYLTRRLKSTKVNIISGAQEDDRLVGQKGNDMFMSGDGNDILSGGLGNDIFIGGKGVDITTGGKGADTFTYLSTKSSGTSKNKWDIITDFDSKEGDKIDLSSLREGLTFIGSKDFSRIPGQVRFDEMGLLQVSLNKKGMPDMAIAIPGVESLSAADLIL